MLSVEFCTITSRKLWGLLHFAQTWLRRYRAWLCPGDLFSLLTPASLAVFFHPPPLPSFKRRLSCVFIDFDSCWLVVLTGMQQWFKLISMTHTDTLFRSLKLYPATDVDVLLLIGLLSQHDQNTQFSQYTQIEVHKFITDSTMDNDIELSKCSLDSVTFHRVFWGNKLP